MSPYYQDDAVTVLAGDCLEILPTLPDCSVDAVCTDPPYNLSFMGRSWDTFPIRKCGQGGTGIHSEHAGGVEFKASIENSHGFQVWCEAWARECLRVLKPGGHLLAFGGTRTHHRLACAVEDAGFEIRDSIAWLYGSGFPKSLDVSKAIDAAAGAERQVVGTKLGRPGYSLTDGNGDHRTYSRGLGNTGSGEAECAVTAPATPAAERWQGWGTALKPAHEPVVVARRPLAGTVGANVLAHGTGALNIDGCRVATTDILTGSGTPPLQYGGANSRPFHATAEPRGVSQHEAGRWPANVLLDESQAAALDEQSGIRPAGGKVTGRQASRTGDTGIYGAYSAVENSPYGDIGGASRFFPTFRYEAKAGSAERPTADGVLHPTVKPLDLMRWLVRLVTPPGGTVLDPFLGSGTTAEACVVEGFRCIGIEREPTYLPLIVARLSKPIAGVLDFGEFTA